MLNEMDKEDRDGRQGGSGSLLYDFRCDGSLNLDPGIRCKARIARVVAMVKVC